jgi:hypothetical protein
MSVFQGLDTCLNDVDGCFEIGLADAEIDDVLALGGKFLGAGEDLEGTLGAEAGHGLGKLEHFSRLVRRSGRPN